LSDIERGANLSFVDIVKQRDGLFNYRRGKAGAECEADDGGHNAAVPKIALAQAREMIGKGNAPVVDARDAPEVQSNVKRRLPRAQQLWPLPDIGPGNALFGASNRRYPHLLLNFFVTAKFISAEELLQ
jgi:hypothetical protein